jgi:hypothetical protein
MPEFSSCARPRILVILAPPLWVAVLVIGVPMIYPDVGLLTPGPLT